ncbi:acyl-CoA N-acyltransferase [Spinellus fusiger]|nr:acyl-CoA N-acyltransferase [Spinellus fusiger]
MTQQPSMNDLAEWVANTTESTEIQLVRFSVENNEDYESNEDNDAETDAFAPNFTYPIFGEQESVFGYKGLRIKIHFASGSMQPFLRVEYADKYKGHTGNELGGLKPAAIEATLRKYMSNDIITDYSEFLCVVQQDAEAFKPIGEKVGEYSMEEEHFEIYKSSFTNEKFKMYHERIQIFSLFFIEGSSYIESDDEKWEIYTVFQKEGDNESSVYHLVGYCTAYPFFCWPENIRMRISQFLIMPTYQKQGHGSKLYQTLYTLLTSFSQVKELTVEDPNEEFSDMRDKNDMRMLISSNALEGLVVPVPEETIKELQIRFKLTERQIRRCVEMHLLTKINKLDSVVYRAYRNQVKQRLYLFNIDALRDMDIEEVKKKLHETYIGVEGEYHDILDQL